MADFSIRSDAVDVEQIMRQIRSRIREKRGADYTEQEIRRLATAKLETFLDPTRVRSGLLEQFRRARTHGAAPPNFGFEDSTIFETHRPLLRFLRRLLRPILKLFFNPNPIAEALHIQAKLNERNAADQELYYEVIHNLVVELTRLGIEVRNMKMRLESVASRIDFNERRSRALEGVVQYRPEALQPKGRDTAERSTERAAERSTERAAERAGERAAERSGPGTPPSGDQAERRRRRRRRGRRRHGEPQSGSQGGEAAPPDNSGGTPTADAPETGHTDAADAPPPADDEP
ncbi:MAG TPA: hypothetical protein VK886_04335 [Vicinamibacterales bacterium]|nr:hypothetical protein [Vicinamibacterales bacterium]